MGKQASLFTPVLIGGSVIVLISFAIRSTFGVFQIPIADDFGWLRAEFSLWILRISTSRYGWTDGRTDGWMGG